MPDKGVRGTVEPSQPPREASGESLTDGLPFGQRIFSLRNVLSILLTLVILYLVYRELLGFDWREVWAGIREVNTGLFALGFAIFYCSFPVRALRWKVLLTNVGYDRSAGYPMPSTFGLTRIMYLAWFANCITVARLGDAYRCYLLRRAVGVSLTVTLGTVLAERLLDLLVMAAMMGAGALVVFHGSLPSEATRALAVGLILSVIGVVGLLSMRRLRVVAEWALPTRLHTYYARFEHGLVGSFHRLPALVAYSAIGWVLEAATLYVVLAAVDAPVAVAGALVVALGASLLTVVPFTPSGLGFTEAGLVVMLGWLGLDAPTATAATLLLRLINYWSIVALGSVVYVSNRSKKSEPDEGEASMSGTSMRIHRFFTGRS